MSNYLVLKIIEMVWRFRRLRLGKSRQKGCFASLRRGFVDNVLSGIEGLCITRQYPPKIRKKYSLEKTPIVWLTETKAEPEITINAIQDLSILINSFLDKASNSIVLLDGFEYLIATHGFDRFMHFLQLNTNRFQQKNSILIAPLFPSALEKQQAAQIEREMKPLKTM